MPQFLLLLQLRLRLLRVTIKVVQKSCFTIPSLCDICVISSGIVELRLVMTLDVQHIIPNGILAAGPYDSDGIRQNRWLPILDLLDPVLSMHMGYCGLGASILPDAVSIFYY
jgi:hypothetical protein